MKFYDQFVGLVARGRTGMGEQAIRDTEARTYIGQDAIERGLADRMASLDEVLNDLSSTAHGAKSRSWFGMTKTIEAAPQADIAGISPEAHSAAIAAARAEGRAEGVAAERARIGAIVRSEAAEGRGKQAMALALDTDLDAEQAAKVLGVAPTETAASTIPSIAERAAVEREFGSAPSETPGPKSASLWASAVKSANLAIGVKP
jgi:ClpP class serine protease